MATTSTTDPGLAHVADLLRYGSAAMPGSRIVSSVTDGEIAWLTLSTPHGELMVRISRPDPARESDQEYLDRRRREDQRNPYSPDYRRESALTLDADDPFAAAMADAFEPLSLDDLGDLAPERCVGLVAAVGTGFDATDEDD